MSSLPPISEPHKEGPHEVPPNKEPGTGGMNTYDSPPATDAAIKAGYEVSLERPPVRPDSGIAGDGVFNNEAIAAAHSVVKDGDYSGTPAGSEPAVNAYPPDFSPKTDLLPPESSTTVSTPEVPTTTTISEATKTGYNYTVTGTNPPLGTDVPPTTPPPTPETPTE